MLETIHREAVYLWYYFSVQFEQIFKYWVLGMLIGSAVSVFLKERILNCTTIRKDCIRASII